MILGWGMCARFNNNNSKKKGMMATSALCRCLSSCCADFCLALSPLVGVEFSFGLSLRHAGSMVMVH